MPSLGLSENLNPRVKNENESGKSRRFLSFIKSIRAYLRYDRLAKFGGVEFFRHHQLGKLPRTFRTFCRLVVTAQVDSRSPVRQRRYEFYCFRVSDPSKRHFASIGGEDRSGLPGSEFCHDLSSCNYCSNQRRRSSLRWSRSRKSMPASSIPNRVCRQTRTHAPRRRTKQEYQANFCRIYDMF